MLVSVLRMPSKQRSTFIHLGSRVTGNSIKGHEIWYLCLSMKLSNRGQYAVLPISNPTSQPIACLACNVNHVNLEYISIYNSMIF